MQDNIDVRETLIELVKAPVKPEFGVLPEEAIADHLMDHGVTILQHGYWSWATGQKPYKLLTVDGYRCSVCEELADEVTDFCPYCGAMMDVVKR